MDYSSIFRSGVPKKEGEKGGANKRMELFSSNLKELQDEKDVSVKLMSQLDKKFNDYDAITKRSFVIQAARKEA